MKMYSAAVWTNNYCYGQRHYEDLTTVEQNWVMSVKHILESFHYISKNKIPQQIRDCGRKVFLDSGAFSAFTLKKEITITEYCEFIELNRDIILVDDGVPMIAGLDGIGDALLTYNNLKEMEALGCYAIPTFHFGEDERYLEYYIAHYPYLALGGLVGKERGQVKTWLDRIWGNYLLDSNGNAKIKVHCFGITSFDLMWMYPWHSVDSSTWIQAASFGMIMTAEYGNISVSTKSPSRHLPNQHFCNISKDEQEYLLETLIKPRGFDYDRLSTSYQSRVAFNLASYESINNAINKRRLEMDVHHMQQDLF